jgi:hypothetical protein
VTAQYFIADKGDLPADKQGIWKGWVGKVCSAWNCRAVTVTLALSIGALRHSRSAWNGGAVRTLGTCACDGHCSVHALRCMGTLHIGTD